ncbi:MAG TPA: bifunctional diaminohydroxyphosphoribosylaminopyrimidine deaminase/5-amino-6-(5-phosphoribosylamino)uracil reductase RibD, partial [Bacteroidota bacterium]
GILKEAAERLNEKFFTFMKTGLPFVGVKIAQTLDGKIADVSGTSKWVTGEQARQYAHGLRAEYDAVLIGASTVARDNPQLTVRHAHGRNPVRIVLDGKLSAPVSARVFRASVARTLLFTSTRAMRERQRNVRLLSKQGVEVVAASNSYSLDLSSVLSILARLNISSVLIEGGSETLRAFLDSKLVHYVHCFVAPKVLGGGLNGWKLTTPLLLAKSIDVANMRVTAVGRDILIEGRLKYV